MDRVSTRRHACGHAPAAPTLLALSIDAAGAATAQARTRTTDGAIRKPAFVLIGGTGRPPGLDDERQAGAVPVRLRPAAFRQECVFPYSDRIGRCVSFDARVIF
jgi:hypothetical protein